MSEPLVRVTFPNGGERFQPNQQIGIQWQSSDAFGLTAHDVKFSSDGGTSFTDIATNLPGFSQGFNWSVPNLQTSQGVVRVVARNTLGLQSGDRSDAPFTIGSAADTLPPTVQVTFPNGGQQFQPGQQVTIQWISSDNVGVVAHDVKFSSDGGISFFDIATNLPGFQQSFGWIVPSIQTNQGVIRVVARDAAGNQGGDRSDTSFTIAQTVDTIPPTVQVTFPNGGQQFQPGQQVTITWTSSDNVGVVAHDVKFSATGVDPFQDIVTNLPGSQKSFNWTVPNLPTAQGVIRVVARDTAGNQGGDRSDTSFTIAQTVDTIPPTVQVTFPNGGQQFQPGQQVTITWTSSDNVGVVAHDVKFSATGVDPFQDIVTNLPGSQKSFNWTVPNLPTNQGVIRVVARDAAGNQGGDRSDTSFTIAQPVDTIPPTVQVTFPNGGQQFQPGQQVTITWTSSDTVGVVAHDVKFSATGGDPFQDIVTNLPGAQKSFNWTVPNLPTNQGVIRVVARDAAGNQGGDRSDTSFTIAQTVDTIPPTVQVTFPNGGQQFQPGQQVTITWTSSDNVGVVAHDVKFSATGGDPFTDIVTNLPGAQKSFTWAVPNTPTNQGVIRVVARDAAGNQGGDRSDTSFTIAQPVDTIPPTVQVTFPNGGQQFQPGQQVTITWTSSDNVGVVAHDVKFSSNGGGSFVDVATNLPGSQKSFAWTVPNVQTAQGVIRVVVRDGSGNSGADQSDAVFSIQQVAVVVPSFQLIRAQVIDPETGPQPVPLAAAVPPIQAGQKLELELTPERVVDGRNVFEDVAISVEGVPPDSQLSVVPNPAQSFQSFLVTIDTAFTTPPDTYRIKVKGRSTRDQQEYDTFVAVLEVRPAPRKVLLAVTPPSQTVKSGTPATYAVALTRTPTSQGLEVTLSLSDTLPPGASSRFDPPKPTGNTASLIITTLPTTPTSTSFLTVKGTVMVEDGKVTNAPPVALKTFIPTVAVQARNRLLDFDDPVKECKVELRGGTAVLASTVTDQSGMAQLSLPGVEDGVYQVAFLPKDNTLDPVGPNLAATEPRPERIWRTLGAVVRLAGDRIVEVFEPALRLDTNGKLIANLQPVFMKSKQTGGSRAPKAATLCVVHQSGTDSVSSNINEFLNNKSVHYLVDTDGQVIKFAHESQIAFHAGHSHWKGQDNANTFSVGIEQVHKPGTPYPSTQLKGTQDLIARLIQAGITGIVAREVVGHVDVATKEKAPFALGRKFGDPGEEFDWAALRARGFGLPLNDKIPLAGIYKGLFDKFPTLRLVPNDTDSPPRYGGRTDTGIPGGVIGELQRDLRMLGYYCLESGKYDPVTVGAVGAFQEHFFSGSMPRIPLANKGTTDKRTAELIKQARSA